jgi:hypothetical protein
MPFPLAYRTNQHHCPNSNNPSLNSQHATIHLASQYANSNEQTKPQVLLKSRTQSLDHEASRSVRLPSEHQRVYEDVFGVASVGVLNYQKHENNHFHTSASFICHIDNLYLCGIVAILTFCTDSVTVL